jgi:hypothetical protein
MVHFAGEYLDDRCRRQRNLGENHSDNCSVPVPPLDVRFSRYTGQRTLYLFRGANLISGFQKARELDKHQDKPTIGTLRSVSLQTEHLHEKRPGKYVSHGLRFNGEKSVA